MKTNLPLIPRTGFPRFTKTTGIGQRNVVLGNSVKLFCLVAVLFAASAWRVLASDPVGIYAFVDKVVLEPNDTAPERIQIWGGFALAEGNGYKYAPAQRGYMYFKVKPDKETLCRNEWADLKSLAGTGKIVGFGGRYQPRGTVRKADAKPADPDVYPIGWGMQKVSMRDYPPINELNALMPKKPDGKKAK